MKNNTQIKIAPSVDKGHILIRILNRKPWLSRYGDMNDIRQSTFVRSDSSMPGLVIELSDRTNVDCRISLLLD